LFRVFGLPLLRNAQKRDNTKTEKTTGGGGDGGKKSRIFCDEPRSVFLKKKLYVFELPLLRNAQKRDNTQIDKNNNKKKSLWGAIGGFSADIALLCGL
jgi:hypothetical protein